MDDKSQIAETQMRAAELSKALFEMRDSLVLLSLVLKDSLFETYLTNQSPRIEALSSDKKCGVHPPNQQNGNKEGA